MHIVNFFLDTEKASISQHSSNIFVLKESNYYEASMLHYTVGVRVVIVPTTSSFEQYKFVMVFHFPLFGSFKFLSFTSLFSSKPLSSLGLINSLGSTSGR